MLSEIVNIVKYIINRDRKNGRIKFWIICGNVLFKTLQDILIEKKPFRNAILIFDVD